MTLEEYVARQGGGWRAVKKAFEEASRGVIRLEDPDPPATPVEYALRPEYSLWYWATCTAAALTIITVVLTSWINAAWLMPLRYILGALYTLFIPGYTLVEALYPGERDLAPLERLALSIGLSLAVIPLIGLFLNYTPWGIRLEPVLASITVFTVATATIALYRKHRVLQESRR